MGGFGAGVEVDDFGAEPFALAARGGVDVWAGGWVEGEVDGSVECLPAPGWFIVGYSA